MIEKSIEILVSALNFDAMQNEIIDDLAATNIPFSWRTFIESGEGLPHLFHFILHGDETINIKAC